MSNETMTDARALADSLDQIQAASYDSHGCECIGFPHDVREVLKRAAARLRGEAAQGEQQAVYQWRENGCWHDITAQEYHLVHSDPGNFVRGETIVYPGMTRKLYAHPQPAAASEQQPVAWRRRHPNGEGGFHKWLLSNDNPKRYEGSEYEPLHNRPQPVAVAGDAVRTALDWLRSALDCAEFIWEADQAKDAEAAYGEAVTALSAAPATPDMPPPGKPFVGCQCPSCGEEFIAAAAAPAPADGEAASLPSIVREVLEWYASDPSLCVAWNEEGWSAEKAAKASGHYTFVGEDRYGHSEYVPNSVRAEEALAALDEWLAQDRASQVTAGLGIRIAEKIGSPASFGIADGDGCISLFDLIATAKGDQDIDRAREWLADEIAVAIDELSASQPAAPDAQEVRNG
ncbi:hypothetical protein ABE488_00930 [Luteimonas sp. TWI662]|uniref:hypothetical protein n=1 Tax=Luteimonas sp. TWI662 TaxID=3136789 RepID=UPI00320AAF11